MELARKEEKRKKRKVKTRNEGTIKGYHKEKRMLSHAWDWPMAEPQAEEIIKIYTTVRSEKERKHLGRRGDSNTSSSVRLVGEPVLLGLKIKLISACNDSFRLLCNTVQSEKLLHCAAHCPLRMKRVRSMSS
jgi:hypothetical protein